MNKPKFLRILVLTAAALTAVGIMLNILMVLNPHIAAILMRYGSIKELMEAKVSGNTQRLMLAQAAAPVLLLTFCGIIFFSDKPNTGKSKLMIILLPIAYIATGAIGSSMYTFALKSAVSDGMNTLSLLSSITTVRSFLSYLYTFSFTILMCAVSLEYYIAKTAKQQLQQQ